MVILVRDVKDKKYGLTFDDVSIIPGHSQILPGETNVKTRLTKKIRLNIPIISAAMDTVTESNMAIAMARCGGLGVIHQYLSPEKQVAEVKKVKRFESWIIENPITIRPSESIAVAKDLMFKNNISGIPVTDNGQLVGIITKRDILFVEDDYKRVNELMTRRLVTVNKGITREEAKRRLHRNKIEKLLVVNERNELEGLITVKDILKIESFPDATRDKHSRLMVGAAVGVMDMERVNMLLNAGVDVIFIDSAHGHSQRVINTLREIKKNFDIDVVAGNVVTKEATEDLIAAGADGIKVGIGSGSICTTRIVTGVGVPQITAVECCVEVANTYNIPVISDGGIKQYGDIAKAIAAGASVVMIGGLLAGTEEAPGKKILLEGRLYKEYRGMGSEAALEARFGTGRYMRDPKGKIVPEGIEGLVDFIGSVKGVIEDMVGGLRHAMGYTGLKTLEEFRTQAKLIEIAVGGQREAHPTVRITKEPRNYRRPFEL